ELRELRLDRLQVGLARRLERRLLDDRLLRELGDRHQLLDDLRIVQARRETADLEGGGAAGVPERRVQELRGRRPGGRDRAHARPPATLVSPSRRFRSARCESSRLGAPGWCSITRRGPAPALSNATVTFLRPSSDITRAARSSASSTSGGGVAGTPFRPSS